jgi:NADPH-dependent ferric siderophore reductase
VRFVPHPSVRLVFVRYPADAIWRAVLAGDDAALSAIAMRIEQR